MLSLALARIPAVPPLWPHLRRQALLLERVLQLLPGMHADWAEELLGVKPMERAEAVAGVLRGECSVWEARVAYRDSHMLYHRQRLALLLQAACRRRHAQLEVWERRVGVWERTKSAAARLAQQGVARAFTTWESLLRARAEALQRLEGASRVWRSQGAARACRTWMHVVAKRKRALQRLQRATAAMLLRGPRLALNQWCSFTLIRLQVRAMQLHAAPSLPILPHRQPCLPYPPLSTLRPLRKRNARGICSRALSSRPVQHLPSPLHALLAARAYVPLPPAGDAAGACFGWLVARAQVVRGAAQLARRHHWGWDEDSVAPRWAGAAHGSRLLEAWAAHGPMVSRAPQPPRE